MGSIQTEGQIFYFSSSVAVLNPDRLQNQTEQPVADQLC